MVCISSAAKSLRALCIASYPDEGLLKSSVGYAPIPVSGPSTPYEYQRVIEMSYAGIVQWLSTYLIRSLGVFSIMLLNTEESVTFCRHTSVVSEVVGKNLRESEWHLVLKRCLPLNITATYSLLRILISKSPTLCLSKN
jgi:hypothetical protein